MPSGRHHKYYMRKCYKKLQVTEEDEGYTVIIFIIGGISVDERAFGPLATPMLIFVK